MNAQEQQLRDRVVSSLSSRNNNVSKQNRHPGGSLPSSVDSSKPTIPTSPYLLSSSLCVFFPVPSSLGIGNNWVLLILHPHKGFANWIDSLHGQQNDDVEQLVDLVYTLKYTSLRLNKPRRKTMWQAIKCPHNPNLNDCGYYVLRFMHAIILRRSHSVPKIWYEKKDAYSYDEIEEVRKE